jgi:hypothetical protein
MIVRTTAMRDVTLIAARVLGGPSGGIQFRFEALAWSRRVQAGAVSGRALAGARAWVAVADAVGRGA